MYTHEMIKGFSHAVLSIFKEWVFLVKDCRVENTENLVIGGPTSLTVQLLKPGHLEEN